MTWEIFNSLGRILLVMVAVYKVYQFHDRMIGVERAGLCVMASGCLLTVPVIWDPEGSPFEGWASSLLTFGALVFIAGRTWRDRRHVIRNLKSVEDAQHYLRERGKL